jgi:vitamin B12 transporter
LLSLVRSFDELRIFPVLEFKPTPLAGALALVFTHQFATAAEPVMDTSMLLAANYRPAMEYMLISSTRTEINMGQTLAPVDVIDRIEVERLQAVNFIDAIRHSPGVNFARSGGPGSASSIYLRGTNAAHTLFLLDGQRVSSATLGSTNFEIIPAEMIERIEIVRGPRSSLYGADAIGGVIQVFTRQPGSEPSAYVKAGYGSNHSYQLAAGGDGRLGDLRYGLFLNHYDTQGIDNLIEDTPPNDDDDAFRYSTGLFKLGYDWGDVSLDFGHLFSTSEAESDATFAPEFNQPYNRGWVQNSYLALRAPLTSIWHSSASLSRAIDDNDQHNERNPLERYDFRTVRDSASWQNDFSIHEGATLTVGVDYYDEKIDSSSVYSTPTGEVVKSRDNIGYFAQYFYNGDRFDLQLGLREDDNEAYDTETTGNISLGFHLGPEHRLIVSYGEAFLAPTFNDLYWPVDPWTYGNPNLRSESSENYEIEVRGDYDKLRWSLSVYQNHIDDLIEWAPDPTSPVGAYSPNNVANAEIDGLDFRITTELAEWLVTASFSYVDATDADNDRRLVNRAQRTLNLEADRSFGRWDVGATWRVQDERYANALNTQRLGGYGLLDLRASYNLDEHWQFGLKLDNVFDKHYRMRGNYNQEGAGWFATVTYRM